MMEIRLDPEALGHVTLRLEVTDGTANVAIVTERPKPRACSPTTSTGWLEALARAGLDLGQHSAGTGSRDGQSGRERPTDAPAQPGPARSDATAPTSRRRAARPPDRPDRLRMTRP